MAILIGILTFIMVLIAAFLILLVLVQLPKKEAGVGMAFGAGMSEMLLGAGSGNLLTRITKYTVISFLGGALILSVLVSGQARKSGMSVGRAIEEQARNAPKPAAAPVVPATRDLLPLATNAAAPQAQATPGVTPAPIAAPATAPITPPAAPATSAPAATPTNKPAQ